MAFHIMGAGHSGISAGSAFLAFKYNNEPLLFSAWCQGTSCSKIYTARPFQIKNQVDGQGDEVLFNFIALYVVEIAIPDGVALWGTVNFSMKITEQESNRLRYHVERKPDVKGVSTGQLAITTKFDMKHDLSDSGEKHLWQSIWNGELVGHKNRE